jgi:L-lactate permease
MSDYELYSAFAETWSVIWLIFATYLTVTFAFLVVGYLVSRHLTPAMVSLVVALYSLVSAWCAFAINRWVTTAVAMTDEIKRLVVQGESTLGWTTMATTPDVATAAIPFVLLFITVGAYAGSIVFFFHQRSRGT